MSDKVEEVIDGGIDAMEKDKRKEHPRMKRRGKRKRKMDRSERRSKQMTEE